MGTQRTLVVATRSEGKLRELLPLLDLCGWRGVTLTQAGIPYVPEEEAIEAFDSFEENALAKARWFLARQQSPSALPVLADDSGLCVDALDGAPGVRSKRWSGSDLAGDPLDAANNAALLRALHNANDRDAHYVCVAVIVVAGAEWTARGAVHGEVLHAGRGAEGFGYDPLFLSHELGKTFGEATLEEKAVVSHRGRAIRALLGRLPSTLG